MLTTELVRIHASRSIIVVLEPDLYFFALINSNFSTATSAFHPSDSLRWLLHNSLHSCAVLYIDSVHPSTSLLSLQGFLTNVFHLFLKIIEKNIRHFPYTSLVHVNSSYMKMCKSKHLTNHLMFTT